MTAETQTVFRCAQCGLALTPPLSKLADQSQLCFEDGLDLVPRGFFAEVDDDYFSNHSGEHAVNLKDAINTQRHTDQTRLIGCCGPDGLNGLNTLCANGHEVGTERSDCWMAHSLLLHSSAVDRAES